MYWELLLPCQRDCRTTCVCLFVDRPAARPWKIFLFSARLWPDLFLETKERALFLPHSYSPAPWCARKVFQTLGSLAKWVQARPNNSGPLPWLWERLELSLLTLVTLRRISKLLSKTTVPRCWQHLCLLILSLACMARSR